MSDRLCLQLLFEARIPVRSRRGVCQATILYYLHNKEAVSNYIADWLEWSHRMQEEQRRNPPPVVIKLKKLIAEKEAMKKPQENDSQISAG
ncbi:hypothetical protein [uncultured Nostoc sp.]|uniref:hypothetical protein n=1 Tax=uncultured Nostoc sp. TaxID=340711 RepID=UPI0035CC1B01